MSELNGRFPVPALSGVCAVLCQNPAGPGIKEPRIGIIRAQKAVRRASGMQGEEPSFQGAHMERFQRSTNPQDKASISLA